ncbi:MAG: hypothetical protein HKP58_01735, partial [Desulfatitalea sp.]|nr:hypothetical protein [Desulfatitalea sp.]NNJ99108.1 hypothetical protein [Desulfatitalea sp.]
MGIARKTTRFKKRIYLFYLFVVAISPFLVSSIFHMVALYLSGDLAWHFVNEQDLGKDVTAQIVLDGQKDDQLRFQGTDPLDSFETEDRMVYPLQEVEYRPVTP